MVSVGREHAVTEAFVSIVSSLAVEGHELGGLFAGLTADCARILDVAWAGLLLADRGSLVVAASSEHVHNLEVFQVQCQEGPCVDCHRSGIAVAVPDLAAAAHRWPRFAPVAVGEGFASVHAVPLRVGDTTVGALGLFGAHPGALCAEDLALGQALAYVAGVALLAGRAAGEKAAVNAQLQAALDSRVVIEQAKGVVAQFGDMDMNQAFDVLRGYARDHGRKLAAVAEAVVARESPPTALLAHARARSAGRG